jgi:hypothetical protein
LTDFSRLEGRNIVIIRTAPPAAGEYEPYFRQVSISTVTVEGAVFYFVSGNGFYYDAYRQNILAPIRDTYYDIPKFLPYKSCSFFEKYFPPGK